MTTTKTPTPTSTATVLRRIRKLLPTGFKKIKVLSDSYFESDIWPGYTNGTLNIQIKGVCKWNAKTTEKESCQATQIFISSTRHGVNSRSYRPRKDGTFNFDGIGTGLQLMVVQDAARGVEIEKTKKSKAAADKAAKRNLQDLRKLAKQRKWDEDIVGQWDSGKHGDCSVSLSTRGEGINMTIRGLSLSQVDAIMESVA